MACSELTPNSRASWQQVVAVMQASGYNRSVKQCREQWTRTMHTRKTFTPAHDYLLLTVADKFGTIWSEIARRVETFNTTDATQLRNRYSALKRIRGGCVRRLSLETRVDREALFRTWLANSPEASMLLTRCREAENGCSETETLPYVVAPMLASRALLPFRKRKTYSLGPCFQAITEINDCDKQARSAKRKRARNATAEDDAQSANATKRASLPQSYGSEKRGLSVAIFADGKLQTLSHILMNTNI